MAQKHSGFKALGDIDMDGKKIEKIKRLSGKIGNFIHRLDAFHAIWDEYGETPLFYAAFNRLAFLTKKGGSVSFNPAPSGGSAENLFDGKGVWVHWANPSGDIVVEITLETSYSYMRELMIQWVGGHYPTSFKIEYYKDGAWHTFDDVTGWDRNSYCKKTGGDLYNTEKLRLTMREYKDPNYVHISQIIWTNYSVTVWPFHLFKGGDTMYGDIDLNSYFHKKPKNYPDATLSGTPKIVEIKIDGQSYYFKVYPTKS